MEPSIDDKAELTNWLTRLLWASGVLLAAGAYWQSGSWKRSVVVLVCVGGFIGCWRLVMLRTAADQAARRARRERLPKQPHEVTPHDA